MLARRFFYFFLVIILLVTACQNETQNSTSPSTTTPQASQTPTNTTNNPDTVLLDKKENIKVGLSIPEILTTDITGNNLTIGSRLDKQGQLLMVYAPSCPVCHATMPRVATLYSGFFQQRNIPVIALSVQPKAATEFSVKELNIPFKVAVMPDVDQKFGCRVPDIPTTIALGADGSIKGIWVGQLGSEQMTEIIKIFCPDCNIQINQS